MRDTLVTLCLLGLAALPARAQQAPVQLRFSTASGRSLRYRTDVDAWLRSPMIPAIDTVQPTVKITVFSRRTFTGTDSTGRLSFAEFTDSSRVDMPQIRALNPAALPPGDFLRGMRSITTMDVRGRNVSTRVIDTPNMPQDLAPIAHGAEGLATTTLRMAILALPGAPVRPGDSWTDSLRYDEGGAAGLQNSLVTVGGTSRATFRLERIETRGSTRIAVITTIASISAGAAQPGAAAALTISASGHMDLDLNDGVLIQSQMDLVGPMMTRGGLIPVHVHMVMQAL